MEVGGLSASEFEVEVQLPNPSAELKHSVANPSTSNLHVTPSVLQQIIFDSHGCPNG